MQISCTVYLDNATEELLFFQLQDGFYIDVWICGLKKLFQWKVALNEISSCQFNHGLDLKFK